MLSFTAVIKKFASQGEKTGWTYIEIPALLANELKPNYKRLYRVKGLLDKVAFEKTALVPMGEGNFILALNLSIRKVLKKREGESIKVKIEVDETEILAPAELIECMEDEPIAKDYFYSLPKSHQNYFTRWIESAKTDATKAKRIAQTINALSLKLGFGEMIRKIKENKVDLPG